MASDRLKRGFTFEDIQNQINLSKNVLKSGSGSGSGLVEAQIQSNDHESSNTVPYPKNCTESQLKLIKSGQGLPPDQNCILIRNAADLYKIDKGNQSLEIVAAVLFLLVFVLLIALAIFVNLKRQPEDGKYKSRSREGDEIDVEGDTIKKISLNRFKRDSSKDEIVGCR